MSIFGPGSHEDIARVVSNLSDRVAALEARLPKVKERYVIRVGHDHLWISGKIFKVLTRDDADAGLDQTEWEG